MDVIVSSKGGRAGFVYRDVQDTYRALHRKGYSKSKSARIANAQHSNRVRKVTSRTTSSSRRGKSSGRKR